MFAIYTCNHCNEPRVYGNGAPQIIDLTKPSENDERTPLLVCQKEGMLRVHSYSHMSTMWEGRYCPLASEHIRSQIVTRRSLGLPPLEDTNEEGRIQ